MSSGNVAGHRKITLKRAHDVGWGFYVCDGCETHTPEPPLSSFEAAARAKEDYVWPFTEFYHPSGWAEVVLEEDNTLHLCAVCLKKAMRTFE